ncbi:hypothetical protein ES703_50646 [subsurface metagenome]
MQEITRPPAPLVEVKESEKRTLAVEEEEEEQLFGTPVMRINRYSGSDKEWVELVRWDIPASHLGDLHSVTLISDQIAKTLYRLVIGNLDQDIPLDRPAYSPLEMVWRRNQVPAKTSVYVEVMSLDGTEIAVNALLTGSVKWVDIIPDIRDNKK